jgi:protein tyrosine/serine phosphatase
MTRRLSFEGLENFRDFGGYAAGHRRMARGRFYRSAHHAEATPNDLERLAAMDIAAVIDLRRPDERERYPSRRWENFAARVVHNDDNHDGPEMGEDSYGEFLRNADLSAASFRDFLIRFYSLAPFAPRHVHLFSRYFDTVAEAEGPIVVHCRAGKDRTGLIVALTHVLAGVHRDDMLADYLATNDPERIRATVPHVIKGIHAEYGRAPSEEAATVCLSVEPAYLESAFAAIEERHGGIETYVRDVLGVDANKRAQIERRLFEA